MNAVVVPMMADPQREPLTPPECDLRDYAFMPLDVVRLRDSDAAGMEDPEAFRANVLSWCVAWHQVPAASLPNDDGALCRLLGYGRDMATWARARANGALHGYVLCADGRLYHPVIAEKANEAWAKKLGWRERSRKGNQAWWGTKGEQGPPDPAGMPTTSNSDPSEIPKKSKSRPSRILQGSQGIGIGIGRGREEKEKGAAPAEAVAGASDAAPLPLTPAEQQEAMKRAMWQEARTIFAQVAPALGDKEPGQLMGALVSANGGGTGAATAALHTLRDVQQRVMAQSLPGYALAETPEAQADAVRRYLRKIIHTTKGSAKPQANGAVIPQLDLATAQTPAAMLMALRQQRNGRNAP